MSLINVLCIAWPFFFSPSFPVWESIFCLVERLKTTQFHFSTPINPCATSLLYPSWKNEYKRFEKEEKEKKNREKADETYILILYIFPSLLCPRTRVALLHNTKYTVTITSLECSPLQFRFSGR